MEPAGGGGDEGAEDGGGIEGVGEPVIVQLTYAGVGEAVDEILVLVGVVERRLAVDEGEEGGAGHEEGERECGTAEGVDESRHDDGCCLWDSRAMPGRAR